MDIAFTLRDLLLFLLFCFISAVCVYLIIILKNLNRFFGNMNRITEENDENIKKTITMLPDVTKNINSAALGINENLDKVVKVVDTLDGAIVDSVTAFAGGAENILNFLASASAAFNTILTMISSGRKRGFPRR